MTIELIIFYGLIALGLFLCLIDNSFVKKIKAIDSKSVEEQTDEDKDNKRKYLSARAVSVTGIIAIIVYCIFFIL